MDRNFRYARQERLSRKTVVQVVPKPNIICNAVTADFSFPGNRSYAKGFKVVMVNPKPVPKNPVATIIRV